MLLFMEDAAPVQSVVSVIQVAPLAALPCPATKDCMMRKSLGGVGDTLSCLVAWMTVSITRMENQTPDFVLREEIWQLAKKKEETHLP